MVGSIVGIDMSISKVEAEILRIKEDFSQIPPVKTSKTAPSVQKKKGPHKVIWAVVAVIIFIVLVLVYVLLYR
jgi:hypothetical protein